MQMMHPADGLKFEDWDVATAVRRTNRFDPSTLGLLVEVPELVVLVDPRGNMLWVSSACATVLGYEAGTLVGREALAFVHPDDRDEVVRRFSERGHAGDGSPAPFGARFLREDGSWRWLQATTRNLLGHPGVNACLVSLRDTHDQLAADEALRASERRLRESEARLRLMIRNAPIVLAAFDTDGVLTYTEGGDPATSIPLGSSLFELFADKPDVREHLAGVLAGEDREVTIEFLGIVWDVCSSPLVEDGVVVGGMAACTDVTERTQAMQALTVREQRFRSLVQRSSDIAMIFDQDATILWASPAARLFGYEPSDLEGRNAWDITHPDDVAGLVEELPMLLAKPGNSVTREMRVLDADGEWRWMEEVLTNHLDDPAVGGVVGNLREITERKIVEQELSQLALHDELTGLPKRTELTRRLNESVQRMEAEGGQVTVVFLDLDQFKLVNDSMSHAHGDRLLCEVATRLQTAVRGDDVVARFGGDEFVVLCEGGDQSMALRLAERIEQVLAKPVDLDGESVLVTASIGIAASPPYDAETLLRNADAAMYRAKKRGRARTEFFDEALEREADRALRLRRELRLAIDEQQFILHHQPLFDLRTGEPIGTEALVRWIHPERGMVPPMDFIPAAEETGLIVEIGAWVLETACRDAAAWSSGLDVSVNLSHRQLADRSIVTTVANALEAAQLDPHRLVLEVTESAVMANAELAVACLNELKGLGVRLAIDDFGTGYSSLVYLKRMPVDIVKVDRSFVDGLGDDAEDTAIVTSVVGLAHALGLEAVAEGVETTAQRDHLVELGCDLAQGFLWSRPVPVGDLLASGWSRA
jgi:diguanylate cyclase (GGDEF)-like protein/PAS domain S-box-containing protein